MWPAAEKVVLYPVDPRQQQPRQIAEACMSVERAGPVRRARMLEYLRSLVHRAGLRVQDVSCRFKYGDACKVALSMQAEAQADVMVLTRRRSAEIEAFVLGATATRLLAIAPCDVLITAAVPRNRTILALPSPKLAA